MAEIVEVIKNGKRIVIVDLTKLSQEDREFFYLVHKAHGHVVMPLKEKAEVWL